MITPSLPSFRSGIPGLDGVRDGKHAFYDKGQSGCFYIFAEIRKKYRPHRHTVYDVITAILAGDVVDIHSDGDGTAAISAQEQQAQAAEAVREYVAKH